MNRRTMILVALALVSAGVTFFLAKTWIDSQRDAIQRQAEALKPTTTESVNVLVAKANLPTGLILKPEHVEWQLWPEQGVAKTYIMEGRDKLENIVGGVVRGGIIIGEPITTGRVIKQGDRGFMAAVLAPGKTAISFRATPDTSVSGFIKPGDRVDILMSHATVPKGANPPQPHHIVETILNEVKVLAIDQKTDDQTGKAKLFRNITVEVTKKEAEIITVAKSIGRLSILLRSLSRPDAKPNQVARSRKRRSRTWDTEVSQVLPSIGGAGNQLEVVRGTTQSAVSIPLFDGGGGGLNLNLPSGTAGGLNSASGVARTLAQ